MRVASVLLIAFALLFPAPAPVSATSGPTIIGDPGAGGSPTTPIAAREAWGWIPYWTATDVDTVVDLRIFHGLIYAFLSANSDGTLLASGTPRSTWESESLTRLIGATTRAGGHFAIGVSMMGWSASGEARQRAILGDPALRATLVAETIAAVSARGANAIALDVEPIHDPAGLIALTRELRAAAPADWPILLALPADPAGLPAAELLAPDAADIGMPMFYDYRTAATAIPGNIAPLGPVASGWSVRDDMSDWSAVAPVDRLLAGIPWYGRAWSTTSDAYHAPRLTGTNPVTGAPYPASASPTWAAAQSLLIAYGAQSDPEGGVYTSYEMTGCTAAGGCVRTLYVDDPATHQARIEAAGLAGWRGIGVWAIGYDSRDETLRRQIASVLIEDQTPPSATMSVYDRPVILDAPNAVRWSTEEIAEVNLFIVDSSGAVRRTLPLTGLGGPLSVDFLDDDGAVLPAGIYLARLRVTDAAGNQTIVTDDFPVETRLRVSFSRGRNLTLSTVRFAAAMRGTVDLLRANPDDGDGFYLRRIATGNFPRGTRAYQLRNLPAGRYVLRFTMETPSGPVVSEAAFRVR